MKSFEQLAQSAYQAYIKEMKKRVGFNALSWDELQNTDRECWIAVAKQLWDEFATIQ